MADEANPLHPGLPPDPEDQPQDNPAASEVPAEQPAPAKTSPSEEYIRKLTGGRYKTAVALAKAKDETDKAYHELRGRLGALEERLDRQPAQPDNLVEEQRAAQISQKLEEQGIDSSVVGVFRDLITDEIRNTLEPIARSQQERARVLGDNPTYAEHEQEMFGYLTKYPEEQEVFNQLHAGNPAAAYKYGMRGLAEYKALTATADVAGDAEELSEELDHARTHGQVITQKHRGKVVNTDVAGEKKAENEKAAWEEGMKGRNLEHYMNERLDFLEEEHPGLKKIKEDYGL